MHSNDALLVQIVGAGVFTVHIRRSESEVIASEYSFELTIPGNAMVRMKLDDVRYLSQLVRLIAHEIHHDGHASEIDRMWIQKLASESQVDLPADR